MLGSGLQGRQLRIIGMGGIGQALAQRARAFGMQIVYHNRSAVAPDIEAALDLAAVILTNCSQHLMSSLNCPYSEQTHHLIDAAALSAMRNDGARQHCPRADRRRSCLVEALSNGELAQLRSMSLNVNPKSTRAIGPRQRRAGSHLDRQRRDSNAWQRRCCNVVGFSTAVDSDPVTTQSAALARNLKLSGITSAHGNGC